MDIRQLKYFLAIAEEGQITSAAKKLHIAQPPLSHELKLLENELGVKLVERGSRKIKLTEAGKILKNKAEQIVELEKATIKELHDFNSGLQGTLSIGAVSSSGGVLSPEKIHKFNELYPGIKFEIWEDNTYRILEILNSGVIEIGIVRTPFDKEGLESICLNSEPMVAAYSLNSFDFSNEKSIKLLDLKDMPLIIYKRFEKLIYSTCSSLGFEPNIICETEDARTALHWARSGIGIGVVPKSSVKLVNSNLTCMDINSQELVTHVSAIWVKNRYISSAAKHFIEILK